MNLEEQGMFGYNEGLKSKVRSNNILLKRQYCDNTATALRQYCSNTGTILRQYCDNTATNFTSHIARYIQLLLTDVFGKRWHF